MDKLYTARRVVDFPEFYGGGWDLVTGRKTAQPSIAKSPTAFSCMHIRGTELASVPWNIKRNDEILDSHLLIDMLTDFGPESNWQQGLLRTEIDMLIYGAGLWFRDIDILKRIDPGVTKVLKTSAGITGFLYKQGSKDEKTFKREEIVYFREYHPEDQLDYGIPVIEVCKKSIAAEIEALLMIEAYFRNDAVPGLLLSTKENVTEKEAIRVIKWFNKTFRGSRKKSKVGIVGSDLKPIPVGDNMKDAAVIEILEYAVADICKTFRVDKILVGGMKDATYVNLSESRKFLIEDVIMPRAIEYQNVINQDLVQQVDDTVVFEFAWDEMQILQEDSTLKEERLGAMFDRGIINDKYYREEMGIEESSKGDGVDKTEAAEDKWERKALKALIRGDSPDVSFETDNVEVDRQYLLHGRLSNATTEEAVRACFQ